MGAGRSAAFTTLALLVVSVPGATAAQDVHVDADAGFSRSQPPAGSLAEPATYFLGGVRANGHPGTGPGRWFGSLYGGVGLQGRGGDWASLTLGGGWSAALGRKLGLDARVEGTAFAVGSPTWFRALTLQGVPELSYPIGSVSLLLRGRLGIGGSRFREDLPGPRSPTSGSHLWFAGGGPGIRVPVGDLDVTGRAGAFGSAGGTYGLGSVEVSGGDGRVGWSASFQLWGTPQGARATGSIGVSLPLGGGWKLFGSGGRTEPDPLVGTPVATYATGVVSHSLVRRERETAELYREVRSGPRPTIRFTLRSPGAREVALVGDFNRWKPLVMQRRDGTWTIRVRVAPGTYHFGFMVDGKWFVPADAPGIVSDAWGRDNATLVVNP
ncbi:MAG: glycogen-binding domain-containing protein [Candidatus Palauibacterales bacterium]|nr:glycogen-binding domain-containing protein [Candidatus Palauibacterales bacterium]MDP2529705.1 glycogen-binding domain-containing protein [Candidatus Palauibacterales bacterium]MDP2584121.1 glycogen-binding domain-containing protein [Candidatus Palauibacterales bacterium]